MIKISRWAVLTSVLLLSLWGCARVNESVDTTYNRSVDFSALKTYNWWALHGQPDTSAEDLALIRRLIDADLQAKGLQRTEESPDFLIVVLLRKSQQDETQEFYSSRKRTLFDIPPQVDEGGSASWKYQEGTMVINFVRPQTNHRVWRGAFKTGLDSATTPKKRTALIERAVHQIMKEFPPS